MDRRLLESFVALAEELHFERAAMRRHVTQPAISQQLRQLEAQLRVQLFYRTKRRVSLTAAGEAYLGEARKILQQMDSAAQLARRIDQGQAGHLVVGVTAPALYIVYPEIVARFAERHLQVAIITRELTTAQQEEALRNGEIQVGVLHPPLTDESLRCMEITRLPFDVVLSERNPLAAQSRLSLGDLSRERFILFPRRIGPRLYDHILTLCQEAGFSPEIIIEAFPAQSIIALAACNHGIGLIASAVQHFERPMIVYRHLEGPAPELSIGIAWREDDDSSLVTAFRGAASVAGRFVR